MPLRRAAAAATRAHPGRVQGLWFMCRGEKTPWGTHMAGEEYPPDCEWLSRKSELAASV
jgi:hypothetical protein